jgi:DEAD/DEAH box helicase domain-containing protein
VKNLSFDFSAPNAGPMVLDVETQYLSDEVPGGWRAVEKFRIALVVTWDQPNGLRVWYEEDVAKLLQETEKFEPIVTFNGENFDFKVLSAYGPVDKLYGKSLDMLAKLSKQLGFRVKLQSLAQATLGRGKSGSGTECVTWWRSGDPALRQKAVEYCKMDVELTRDIYQFAKQNCYLLVEDIRQNVRRRIDISW